MEKEISWLRKQPRQQRSMDRIETLLDTAETVFREVGYDNATTNLIAERADIPVGTLYRWFPDKAALAEGLTSRYLARLTARYEKFITSAPPSTDTIRLAVHEVAKLVADSPAMPALTRATTNSEAHSQLRDTLESAVVLMLHTRVPEVSNETVTRITRMVITVLLSVTADAVRLDETAFEAMVDECADLLIAWLSARFPPPEDPVWKIEDPLVQPLTPSLGDRPYTGPADIGGHLS